MKKRNYSSVGVKYFANDAIASVQIPENETESVAAQAEEHKDLRYHVTGDDGESLVVIPWEKVASVTITYDTTDVAAPHDSICCDQPGYSGVDLNGYTPSCISAEVMDPDEDPDVYWGRVYFEKDGAEPYWSYWGTFGEVSVITESGKIAYIKDCVKSQEQNIYGIMGTNSETEGYIKFVDPIDKETVIATYTTGVCE